MNEFFEKLTNNFSPDCYDILFSFSEKRYNVKQEIASKKQFTTLTLSVLAII